MGTNGTALDPNVELKGFTVFGATQAAYTGAVVGPGSVVVNGVLAVSSGAYFVGNSTFTGAGKIFINDGSAGQILRKNSGGYLEWNDIASLGGDNLGNHNATQRLDMGANPIIGVSSLTVIAPDTIASSLWVSTSAVTPHLYVSMAGNVGIGTTTPWRKVSLVDAGVGFDRPAANNLAIYTSNTERIRINSSGFVGVGVTNPINKFSVMDQSCGGFVGMQVTNNVNPNSCPGTYTGVLFGTIQTGNDQGYHKGAVFFEAIPGGYGFGRGRIHLAVNDQGDATSVGLSDAKLTVATNGSVGLGTAAPDQKLTVAGNISQTGVLISSGTGNNYFAGNVGIGTAAPEVKLSLDNDGGIIAKGIYGSGAVLTTAGAGTRMIWYPKKAAFRAGAVAGTQWNNASVGEWSFAAGRDNTASNDATIAMGIGSTASGPYSVAIGYGASATGQNSMVYGAQSSAAGWVALATGYGTTAAGAMSLAAGYGTSAQAYAATVVGANNIVSGTAGSWVATDPIFVVGNGQDASSRSNAVTVLKNGKTGIGTEVPTANLHVSSNTASASQDMLKITTGTASADVFVIKGGGNVGISTGTPQARLDVLAAGSAHTDMAQIWRDSGGVIVGSMSATGVMMASKVIGDGSGLTGIAGDNLGSHVATTTLNMASFNIVGVSTITVSSITTTAAGVTFSTDVFIMKGNLGIGTTAPVAPLTVTGREGGSAAIGEWTASGGNKLTAVYLNGGFATASDYNFMSSPNAVTNHLYINRPSGREIQFRENNVIQAVIQAGGNVGIGMVSPTHKLHVGGNAIITSSMSVSGSGLSGTTPVFQVIGGTMTVLANGNVGIGTVNPRTRLELGTDGAVLAIGTYGSGWTEPNLGAGTRMLWYPKKAAFRAGYVNGTQWDDANIGNYSVAMGLYPTASGSGSIALGDVTTASGIESVSIGAYTTASNNRAVAIGDHAAASASYSTAIGENVTASGNWSTAMGNQITTQGTYSFGIGLDAIARTITADNTMAIMGGNVGIGTPAPGAKLHAVETSAANSYIFAASTATDSGSYKMVVTTSGNVGIGTANPLKGVHVQQGGTSLLTSAYGNGALYSTNDIAGVRILMENLNGAANEKTMAIVNEQGRTYFGILNDSGGAWINQNALVIRHSDGNVGVGTTSPGAKLDVVGNIKATQWIQGGCVNPNDANDIMVAVGPWCVDKYEASVWSTATGGTQYGAASDNYPCNDNGQDCAASPIYARSVVSVTPSAYLTWFQANMACFNSGKELLPNNVWQAAAAGTVDPGATGTAPNCNVSGTGPTTTGGGTSCLSGAGAENMIGSLWEWVAEWGTAGAGASNAMGTTVQVDGTGTGYNDDGQWNIGGNSYTNYAEPAGWIAGQVPAVLRGGGWGDGATAGVFAFSAFYSPSSWNGIIGFRCGRHR